MVPPEQRGYMSYSRLFRERQAQRNFSKVQSMKGQLANDYEELRQLHVQFYLNS